MEVENFVALGNLAQGKPGAIELVATAVAVLSALVVFAATLSL